MQNIGSFKLFGDHRDTGSLHLGGNLPAQYQKTGVPEGLFVQLAGEDKPRKVTYVMGSAKKGWSVCCKGSGKFPTGDSLTIEVDLLVED